MGISQNFSALSAHNAQRKQACNETQRYFEQLRSDKQNGVWRVELCTSVLLSLPVD
jgi:hypothetical protein